MTPPSAGVSLLVRGGTALQVDFQQAVIDELGGAVRTHGRLLICGGSEQRQSQAETLRPRQLTSLTDISDSTVGGGWGGVCTMTGH